MNGWESITRTRTCTGCADAAAAPAHRLAAHRLHTEVPSRLKRCYRSHDCKCTSSQASHASAADDNVGTVECFERAAGAGNGVLVVDLAWVDGC